MIKKVKQALANGEGCRVFFFEILFNIYYIYKLTCHIMLQTGRKKIFFPTCLLNIFCRFMVF